jgi:glycosyltransferase involved in cell wall biosynthesis
MIIAVNTGITGEGQPGDQYIFQYLHHVAKENLQHQFICILNKPAEKDLAFTKNVTTLVAGPGTNNTLLWKYWYNYKLPALLKKHKADVLVSMNGICSLRTKLPQCLFVQDLSFLLYPYILKTSHARFLKRGMPRFLEKAKTVVTTSDLFRSVIIDRYKTAPGKIDVIHGGIDEIFKSIPQYEKESIKEKYAEGREYFLSASCSNGINLLKAFSFFKRRQKSNMMLLITGKADEEFKAALKTFKFRNEVKLIDAPSKKELSKITAAAYVMVHPVFYDAQAMTPLRAMQSEVPVICSNAGALPELCGNAALYFSPGNFEDIAEKMMLVFKDEDRSKELVKAGKTRARLYHWDKTAGLFWQSISKAINN